VNSGVLWLAVGDDIYQLRTLSLQDVIGTGDPATVYLAEQRLAHSFTVESMYVEIVWYATEEATPELSAGIEMRGWTDLASPGRHKSEMLEADLSLVITTPESALYHDDRYVYATIEFRPSAPAGTGVIPIITFDDCKVRRVWMTVRDAGRA
jgi:hypothetical protein